MNDYKVEWINKGRPDCRDETMLRRLSDGTLEVTCSGCHLMYKLVSR